MPRKLREKSLTGIYHVMVRGVNKQNIFQDRQDRFEFCNSLTYYKEKYNIEIYAYCLMSNHVHLLLKDNKEKISDFMKDLNGVYAMYYNSKYKRVGHLFQQRFKSISVENDEYFFEVVKYIHNNPVKAGICEMKDYRWSSYGEYICKEKIIDRKYLLRQLDANIDEAIKKFILFMNDGKEYRHNVYLIEPKLEDNEVKDIIKNTFKIDTVNEIRNIDKKVRNKFLKKLLVERISNINQLNRILGINRKVLMKL